MYWSNRYTIITCNTIVCLIFIRLERKSLRIQFLSNITPAAGRKIELPFLPVTLYPLTLLTVVHSHVHFSTNSFISAGVGIRQPSFILAMAASSSESSVVFPSFTLYFSKLLRSVPYL